MTTSDHIFVASRRYSALLEVAMAILAFVVLAALWLGFFAIVPLDFRPPRVS